MSFKSIILLVLGAALANNCALRSFLGVTPMLGWAGKKCTILPMGLAVTVVMLLTVLIGWPLMQIIPGFLAIPVFVAIILVLVYVLELVAGKVFKKSLGFWFPVIALNSAVLGLAVNALELDFVSAIFTALGSGLGFLLALFVFAGVLGRIQKQYVPKAFKGLPVELLAAGIIAMALYAF